MKITDEELKTLRAKHPRGVVVLNALTEDGDIASQFAFKKIDRAAYAQWRANNRFAVASGGGTGEEEQQLARSLLVWPEDKTAFEALREEAPAIITGFGQELLTDASAGLAVTRDPR